jgi:hypothetical protein
VTTAAFVDALLAGERIELATEADDVVTWRFEQLEQAGYAEMAALAIAIDGAIDLHGACALLRRGCPQAVALDIVF